MRLPTRSAAKAVTAALVVALAATLAGPTVPAAQAATAADRYGTTAVKATKAARRAHHLKTVRTDRCLQRFAARQASRMAAQRRMFHQDIRKPLRACGLRMVGENVAVGYRTGRSAVRQGWMESPPHRANILRPSFRLVAVAARKGSDGRWYASQVFGRR